MGDRCQSGSTKRKLENPNLDPDVTMSISIKKQKNEDSDIKDIATLLDSMSLDSPSLDAGVVTSNTNSRFAELFADMRLNPNQAPEHHQQTSTPTPNPQNSDATNTTQQDETNSQRSPSPLQNPRDCFLQLSAKKLRFWKGHRVRFYPGEETGVKLDHPIRNSILIKNTIAHVQRMGIKESKE
ncbi:hypothetical protein ACOMHN_054597 [Nucella lapillus]